MGHRCLVPSTSFCEYAHRSSKAVPTWFALDDSRPTFFFAGVWRPWTGARGTKAAPVIGDHLLFSFLTTEPNAQVAPIHPKAMPVILADEAARETWINESMEEALALQRPAPDDALRISMYATTFSVCSVLFTFTIARDVCHQYNLLVPLCTQQRGQVARVHWLPAKAAQQDQPMFQG
jgi:putative SOS response-associated peptidase YedK